MKTVLVVLVILFAASLWADPILQMRIRSNDTETLAVWQTNLTAILSQPGCCDEIWFSTGVGMPSLSRHEQHASILAQAAEDVRAAGILPSLQFQATIGHGSDYRTPEIFCAKTWPSWTDWRGVESRFSSCPRQPAFHAYLRAVVARYARVGFSSIWLDDDLRLDNHRPADNSGRHVGCWCETCLSAFNAATTGNWTRVTLANAVMTNDTVYASWRQFSIEGLGGVVRTVAAVVREVSPKTRMGLQQGNWPKSVDEVRVMLETLHEISGADVGYRPGASSYHDGNPNEQVSKSLTSCYFVGELLKKPSWVAEWTPEVESYPRTYYSRSAQSVLVEGFVALMYGMNRISYFVSNSAMEDPALYASRYWKPLAEAAPTLHGFREAVKGAEPVGLTFPSSLSLSVRSSGVPLLSGIGRSCGRLTGSQAAFKVDSNTSRAVQSFRDQLDAKGGGLPARLCSPFFGLMQPYADANGRLRAVALLSRRIEEQTDVRLQLRGLPPAAASVKWHELRRPTVTLPVVREKEGTYVTIPSVGAWNGGYIGL